MSAGQIGGGEMVWYSLQVVSLLVIVDGLVDRAYNLYKL